MDINEKRFNNTLLPIFEQNGYQIDRISNTQTNLKPTKWGKKVKDLGNDLLISLFLTSFDQEKRNVKPLQFRTSGDAKVYQRFTSKLPLGDKLYDVPFNPFKSAMDSYGNSYLEHRFHSVFGNGILHCKSEWHDIWYDYGGKGTGKKPPIVSQEDHNACLPDYRLYNGGGTFFPWQE